VNLWFRQWDNGRFDAADARQSREGCARALAAEQKPDEKKKNGKALTEETPIPWGW